MKRIKALIARCLAASTLAAFFIQITIAPALATFTPAVTPMHIVAQGGEIFTQPAKWIDVLTCSTSASSINITTIRSNMGLAAGIGLFVIISADGPYWANFNDTAVIPVGNTTDGTGSEFAPNQRYLDSTVTAISFVCAANQNVSMQFYRP